MNHVERKGINDNSIEQMEKGTDDNSEACYQYFRQNLTAFCSII